MGLKSNASLPPLLNCQGEGNYPPGWYRQASEFQCEHGPEGHDIPQGDSVCIDRAGHVWCALHAPHPEGKNPSLPVTVYVCSVCSSKFEKQEDADKHCLCKCGRPVARERSWRSDKCPRCLAKERMLHAKARVRSLKADLVSAEENATRLEAEYAALKKEGKP